MARSIYSNVRIWELEGSLQIIQSYPLIFRWGTEPPRDDDMPVTGQSRIWIQVFRFSHTILFLFYILFLCSPQAVLFIYHLQILFSPCETLYSNLWHPIHILSLISRLSFRLPSTPTPQPKSTHPSTLWIYQGWSLLAFLENDPSCLYLCCLLSSCPSTPTPFSVAILLFLMAFH